MTALTEIRSISAARWLRLFFGLYVFGAGIALMHGANLGLGPWDVLSDGISKISGLQLGTVTILVGAAVLSLWLVIRERPGVGTVANILLIGTAVNLTEKFLPHFELVPVRFVQLLLGVAAVGLGSALYLGAKLGPGPRDGLMLGLHQRTGLSIRVARTSIELVVLVFGILLGGTAGIGTVIFAFGIGPTVQFMMRLLKTAPQPASSSVEAPVLP
ncbi:MAG: hypothetical protein NTZ50_03485 [Chloroflexi bacterium]|nr:hypothetical protein [Chloroflexota bacterium]